MSEDLVAFLLARIAEDEQSAREAGELAQGDGVASWSVPCWADEAHEHGDDTDYGHNQCRCCRVEGDNITIYDEGGHDRSQALHIARWDPARVLAECATKRRVIASYRAARRSAAEGPLIDELYDEHDWLATELESLIRDWAAIHSGHPEYRQEWAPEDQTNGWGVAMTNFAEWLSAQLDADAYRARDVHNFSCDAWTECNTDACNCGEPQKLLAEVETKRRIIELHTWSERVIGPDWYCPVCEVEPPCAMLRALTVPYADRPGYQPAWAPPPRP